MRSIDESVSDDFPILAVKMNGKHIAYLDSAATSQKPLHVIDAISDYYKRYNANIHRGIYKIAEEATEKYTESKEKLAAMINAGSYREIVYTRNATESINLVALSWGESNIGKGDHILITEMEHHSNMVPWMVLAKKKGAVLDYVKITKDYTLDMGSLDEALAKRPKIVAFTHTSNVLGTVNDAQLITSKAHKAGAVVLVDGAQSAPHMAVDVKRIGCDFFALSGHKMLGPTGIGALYGREEILNEMEPLFTGGDMINAVTYNSYDWNELPWKFEAGTSDISGGIGLGAAVDYIKKIGIRNIEEHERALMKYAVDAFGNVEGVRFFVADNPMHRAGIVSFAIDGVHPHDVSQIFDSEGIAIRAGHHCAMPLVTERLGVNALSRISFYLYNIDDEIDRAAAAMKKVKETFRL